MASRGTLDKHTIGPGVTVNRQTLLDAIEEMQQQLASKRREMETLQAGIAALQLLVGGRPATPRKSPSSSTISRSRTEGAPRGRAAVKAVLKERPGDWMSIQEIADTLVERGWIQSNDPVTAARTSADRLLKNDREIERQDGDYRFADVSEENYQTSLSPRDDEGGDANAPATSMSDRPPY